MKSTGDGRSRTKGGAERFREVKEAAFDGFFGQGLAVYPRKRAHQITYCDNFENHNIDMDICN